MDKQEYKLRAEEIKALIAKREFFKAVEIADEIDWTRVRSVAMLCTVSDLYKINRRYKESKELLLMAYERHPGGRMILYSLCELCIKMGEVVQAMEYYKEFVRLAPMDNGRYVLQYKLYEAQDVSLEERIAVLEELKKRDYREKWGYELAYLYHRIGLATKCVEECNELILWFSEGRYVKKAMELKMLHQPLSETQQKSYEVFTQPEEQKPETYAQLQETKRVPSVSSEEKQEPQELDIEVKPVNVGQYDTINLQKELAESLQEVLQPEEAPVVKEIPKEEEISEEKDSMGQVTREIMAPMLQNTMEMQEVFFEDKTGEIGGLKEEPVTLAPVKEASAPAEELTPIEEPAVAVVKLEPVSEEPKAAPSIKEIMERPLEEKQDLSKVEPPTEMANLLSEGYDGQISLVVPEEEKIEKQITGQMSIEDVLSEWEKTKKEIEEKRKEKLKQRVLEETGSMFTEFEAKVRDGILEQLEQEGAREEKSSEAAGENPLEEINIEVGDETRPMPTEIIIGEIPPVEPVAEAPAVEEAAAEEEGLLAEVSGPVSLVVEEEEKAEEAEPEISEESSEAAEPKVVKAPISEEEEEEEPHGIRDLTEEEKALFAPFIQTRGGRKRFLKALDLISLAAYTGNVIVTGEADSDTVKLAKNIMKNIQMTDANFSGVIAKVSGSSLNTKNVDATISKLNNGGLIIEKASEMNSQAVMRLLKALNQEKTGIVVILEDNKKAIKRMLAAYPSMASFFTARVEIEELNNDALTAYGKQYAGHLEYSIDEMGMLALQTRIEDMQTSDHVVTVGEVREIVDEAIAHVNKKTLPHFFDILLAKRYDEEDMIILREKDFI